MTMLKSVPLNKDARTSIIENILKASPEQKLLGKHDEKGPALALKLSDHILGPRNKKAYRSLPAGMLNGKRLVCITSAEAGSVQIRLDEGVCHYSNWMQLDDAPATLKRSIESWMDKRTGLVKSLESAGLKVRSLINKFSNTKQLLEEIPDAFQFFPDELKHKCQDNTLPAAPPEAVQEVQKIVAASAKNLQQSAA